MDWVILVTNNRIIVILVTNNKIVVQYWTFLLINYIGDI